jgi:chemotaxis signal transduction protein
VNLRGQLFLVLDPGELLLGLPQPGDTPLELIVFRDEVGESFAIAVERVGDMLPVPAAQIHEPKARTDDVDLSDRRQRAENLTVGHATLDAQLVTLIDPRRLLSAAFADAAPK